MAGLMKLVMFFEHVEEDLRDAAELARLQRELESRWKRGSLGAGILLFLQRNL